MESVFRRRGAVQGNMARYICIHLQRRFYSEGGGLCAEIRQEASEPPIEAATPCNLLEIRVYIPYDTESAIHSVYVTCLKYESIYTQCVRYTACCTMYIHCQSHKNLISVSAMMTRKFLQIWKDLAGWRAWCPEYLEIFRSSRQIQMALKEIR